MLFELQKLAQARFIHAVSNVRVLNLH